MELETKVIYHIDDESTPYLVKIPLPSAQVTLKDFKLVLNKQNNSYKYFFKSMDADFGVVKEEIADDMTILPCFNGRVVSWLVTADGSNQSDNCSEMPHSEIDSRIGGTNLRKPSMGGAGGGGTLGGGGGGGGHMNIPPNPLTYQSASVMSSDLDSTSLFETESEITLDRDMTECSSVQRLQVRKKPQRRKKRAPSMSRTSSYSSITDSTMSLNIITVSINMEAVNFLGISIVGQSNRGGDGGIYVGSIMKGGAVALEGRIEPGDMILQVNDVNFENMTNDEAVRVLREVVSKPGPIKLVVAKCWDPNPKGYFTIPRTEPVRPIDPGAWVAHTQAVTSHGDGSVCHPDGSGGGMLPDHHSQMQHMQQQQQQHQQQHHQQQQQQHGQQQHMHHMQQQHHQQQQQQHHQQQMQMPGMQMMGVGGGGGMVGTMLGGGGGIGGLPPHLHAALHGQRLDRHNLEEVVKAMTKPDSGLEIRDRMWLKINIPNAFIGADAVNWVHENVDGVGDRREARRIVSAMLNSNLIKHTVNKLTFSEQCYYVVSDGKRQCGRSTISLGETDSIASDIAPLPNPPVYMPYSGTYNPTHGYQPIQYGCADRHISSGSSSSDVLTSKDISASQSDITSIIQQTNHMAITNGSNKSSGSSNRGTNNDGDMPAIFL